MFVTTLLDDPRARTAALVLAFAGALFSLYLAGLAGVRDPRLLRLVPHERRDSGSPWPRRPPSAGCAPTKNDARGSPRSRWRCAARTARGRRGAHDSRVSCTTRATSSSLRRPARTPRSQPTACTSSCAAAARASSRCSTCRALPALKLDARGRLGAQGRADPERALDHDRCAGSARPRLAERRPAGTRCASTTRGRTARRCTAGACRCASTAAASRSRARSSAWRGRSLAWPIGAVAAVLAVAGLVLVLPSRRRAVLRCSFGALAVAAVVIPYGESEAVSERSWGALVAAVVALVGLATALQPAPRRRARAGRARRGRHPARAAARRPARRAAARRDRDDARSRPRASARRRRPRVRRGRHRRGGAAWWPSARATRQGAKSQRDHRNDHEQS